MMDFLLASQPTLLIGFGLVCFLLAAFVLAMKFKALNVKKALLKIECSVGIVLISDGLAYIFKGNTGTLGFWMVRITNFLIFTFILAEIYFLCEYITALFMGTGRFEKLPKRLLLGFILPSVGMSLVVLSQFTGMYYSFDSNNVYHRGVLYPISFLIPFVTFLILYSFIVQHRSKIQKVLLWALSIFSILPIIAAVVQLFWNRLSLINVSAFFAALLLFFFALINQNDELTKAAFTELNTGLPNTDGFLYEVDKIIHHQNITDYCGYYFDIVRMSHINNKYGKKVGDEVIRGYASYIRNFLDKDEIVGRLGGNYFVALVKKINTEKFLKMLQDVPLEILFEGHSETIHVAAIAGVYEVESKNIQAGQILGYTSIAVAYAKNVAHKPYVFLDKTLQDEFDKTRVTEIQARKGIKANEFEPFYQPKIDSVTSTMIGAEALVRWRKGGVLIPPMEFIPILERNGNICDLDFYMLERVCDDIHNWLEEGKDPVPVSVNFSRRNLGNPILAEAISKVVEKHGIPKKYIQVEITETLDDYPISYLIGVVEALQRYGLTVAIDDFGTGSSSIGLLKQAQFDVLKIDKFFIDYNNEEDSDLLRDIVQMAKHKKIQVIAEGVEEKEQVETLREMGCTQIQGYVFDKPLVKGEFEKRLANKQYA